MTYAEIAMEKMEYQKHRQAIEIENKRRHQIRNEGKKASPDPFDNLIKKIIYDREVGNYPSVIIDKNLTQNLVDGTSDFRNYARNKYGLQQNDLTSFFSTEALRAKNVQQFESDYKKELDVVISGLEKERKRKIKIAKKS